MTNLDIYLTLIAITIVLAIASFYIKQKLIKSYVFILVFIISIYVIGAIKGDLNRLSYNIWYSNSAKELISELIIKIENGENEIVLEELKMIEDKLNVTYEQQGNFDEIAKTATLNLKEKSKN